MFPKIDPKQMKRMMKQLGMKIKELEASEVRIVSRGEEIVIQDPKVFVIEARNQRSYQISGREKVKQRIPEEDVELVAKQAGVEKEKARKALEKTKGDLAEALLLLQEDKDEVVHA